MDEKPSLARRSPVPREREPYAIYRSTRRPRPSTRLPDDVAAPQLTARRAPAAPLARNYSMRAKVAVGLFLGLVLLAIWQLFFTSHTGQPLTQLSGIFATPAPVLQIPPLLADGISLGQTQQKPALSRQQALFSANQLESDAAAGAQNVDVRYVLLNYTGGSATAHTNLVNVPAWLIWYQNVPLPASDSGADPTPATRTSHDLYVFLDARSGNELLAVWI